MRLYLAVHRNLDRLPGWSFTFSTPLQFIFTFLRNNIAIITQMTIPSIFQSLMLQKFSKSLLWNALLQGYGFYTPSATITQDNSIITKSTASRHCFFLKTCHLTACITPTAINPMVVSQHISGHTCISESCVFGFSIFRLIDDTNISVKLL